MIGLLHVIGILVIRHYFGFEVAILVVLADIGAELYYTRKK